jgi:hypothetical protein
VALISGFAARGGWVCVLIAVVGWAGGLRAHREDGVSRRRCTGRALLAARIRDIGHFGSAHDGAELEAQKAAAWQRLAGRAARAPLACTAPRADRCRSRRRGWGTCGPPLSRACEILGGPAAVLSHAAAPRAGLAIGSWRAGLAAACARPAGLVRYEVPALEFETGTGSVPRASGQGIPGGHVFAQSWPAGSTGRRRNQVNCYQYRAGRARRGFGGQVAMAEEAVAGKAAVTRNRLIWLCGGTKTVNRPWRPEPGTWRA